MPKACVISPLLQPPDTCIPSLFCLLFYFHSHFHVIHLYLITKRNKLQFIRFAGVYTSLFAILLARSFIHFMKFSLSFIHRLRFDCCYNLNRISYYTIKNGIQIHLVSFVALLLHTPLISITNVYLVSVMSPNFR